MLYSKSMLNIAINGYGRIGRVAHRVILEKFVHEIDVVALNAGESTDLEGWMNLLKYDSIYGRLANYKLSFIPQEKENLSFQTQAKFLGFLVIDSRKIPIFSEKDPGLLPWKDLNVDIVIESTGAFRKQEQLENHLKAGARGVVLSAPFKDEESSATYVLGVNLERKTVKKLEKVISNASCTTNCIAPVAKVIEENFGIEKAMMTTIHAYTSDQRLQDGGHKDYRRSRAAAANIIPTSTGATEAAAKTIPSLENKFTGLALRVPTIVGSIADLTFIVKRDISKEEVNKAFEKASKEERFKEILMATYDPIVSSDIIGESYSSIVDLSLTQVVGGNMLKVIAWYDNEYGYCNRLVEEAIILGKSLTNDQEKHI